MEAQTLVIAIGAALWLGIAQSFSYSTGPIYRYMRAADEWTWTCALLLGALLTVLGIVFEWLRCRRLGLMVIAIVWALISICFIAGNPHAFTTWTYSVLAASAAFCSLRLPS